MTREKKVEEAVCYNSWLFTLSNLSTFFVYIYYQTLHLNIDYIIVFQVHGSAYNVEVEKERVE